MSFTKILEWKWYDILDKATLEKIFKPKAYLLDIRKIQHITINIFLKYFLNILNS